MSAHVALLPFKTLPPSPPLFGGLPMLLIRTRNQALPGFKSPGRDNPGPSCPFALTRDELAEEERRCCRLAASRSSGSLPPAANGEPGQAIPGGGAAAGGRGERAEPGRPASPRRLRSLPVAGAGSESDHRREAKRPGGSGEAPLAREEEEVVVRGEGFARQPLEVAGERREGAARPPVTCPGWTEAREPCSSD